MSQAGRTKSRAIPWAFLPSLVLCVGCVNSLRNAVPVQDLPAFARGEMRDAKVPIDFTLLRQRPPAEHLIGAYDLLGIYIQDVLTRRDEDLPVFTPPMEEGNKIVSPAIGAPVKVLADGTIALPLVRPIPVAGLTIALATERIRKAFFDAGILQPDKERVLVSLIKPRGYRVMVIREDTGGELPYAKPREGVVISKRGTAFIVELPAYENDVLHALSETGGLPGIDARNELWVLRDATPEQWDNMVQTLEQEELPSPLLACRNSQKLRIPLRVGPDEGPDFSEQDIVLQTGDVVFIPAREADYFLTGGLLPGGKFPLPRDHDLDIFGAIGTASGAATGPPGTGAQIIQFRGGSGPGNIVPPTRALVVRTLAPGRQIKIYVNLRRALDDPAERLIIQPGDLIVLQYTPGELTANIALNTVNFSYAIH
jgi:polysaccharide biosynthesis/export protein